MTRRALISVYEKAGLLELARGLASCGFELVASGGTAGLLRSESLPVTEVAEITGMPELIGGRVKTLHPAIHAGILATSSAKDRAELAKYGIAPIDLVVCNLYPFAETLARPGTDVAEAIEQIDIGGVTLLRSAAKNHARVTVVCDPRDYEDVLAAWQAGGPGEAMRQKLAAKAFAHTRDYDVAIARYLADLAGDAGLLPDRMTLSLHRVQAMRYGENPHQAAALYAREKDAGPLGGVLLQGKPLSYNNLLDLDAAWTAAVSFADPAVVIVKHLSPCGMAVGSALGPAFAQALASDPVSAFGGVVGANRNVDMGLVARMDETGLFVEAIAAPAFDSDAQDWLAANKRNCRLVQIASGDTDPLIMRSVQNGLLVQQADTGDPPDTTWRVVTEREPSVREWRAMRFAWQACRHVKSNAIVVTSETATLGIGGGLPSRVDAVAEATRKAGERARGAVLASDAFFPFPDGVEAGAAAGVTAVIQPGGSVRDADVIDAANRLGLAMVFTGTRHFRH